MVLPLRPSKFYGSSLPRPRVYDDLKFNSERVDPPLGVTAPLMSWAKDAPWSMGGLSHTKKRMAGKIEGSLKKLKYEHEDDIGKQIRESDKLKEVKSPSSKESVKPKEVKSTERKQIRESEKPKEVKSPDRKQIRASEMPKEVKSPAKKQISEKRGNYTARKQSREREKEKEGKSTAKSVSELETPSRASRTPIFDKSPSESQLIKQKWASEDDLEDDGSPNVVLETIERREKKRSPHVLKRVRRLGEAFNEQALTAATDRVFETPKVRSVARSASKKQQLGKESEVFDYFSVPEKIIKSLSPRRNLKEKGEPSAAPVRRSLRSVPAASKRLAI